MGKLFEYLGKRGGINQGIWPIIPWISLVHTNIWVGGMDSQYAHDIIPRGVHVGFSRTITSIKPHRNQFGGVESFSISECPEGSGATNNLNLNKAK